METRLIADNDACPQRRVATLPPVSAALFNRKIIERRNENAVTATKTGETCKLCR